MEADSVTLQLTNQKNGWKNVCINHHHNGEKLLSPTKAIARRYLHIRDNTTSDDFLTTNLSACFVNGCKYEVTDKDVRHAIKYAAKELNYPENKGIPIERIIHILSVEEVLMHYLLRVTPTGRYRRWVDGNQTPSRNISVISSRSSPKV